MVGVREVEGFGQEAVKGWQMYVDEAVRSSDIEPWGRV